MSLKSKHVIILILVLIPVLLIIREASIPETPLVEEPEQKNSYTIGILSDTNDTVKNYQTIVDVVSEDIHDYLRKNHINLNLTFDVESSQRDPNTHLRILRNLYNADVKLVLGPPWGFMMSETISYTLDNPMFVLGSSSTSVFPTLDDYVFRLSVPYDKEGQLLAEILNRQGYESVVSIEQNDS